MRTVYSPAWPWQLKFSLHVQVTNALRVMRERELRRAVEGARLLDSAVGERMTEIAPELVILSEPAYLLVRHGGEPINGFSVLLRENRWTEDDGADDVSAIAVLCQRHPYGGRSRLAQIVGARAEREGRSEQQAARAWFERYAEVVVVPILRLCLDLGLCLEPHQQSVLVELEDGLPARAVYRDGRIFHRAVAHDDLAAIVPGLGENSDSGLDEQTAEERLIHYLFLNNALGVVSALGSAGMADEAQLLRDLRALVERERSNEHRYPATVLDRLIGDETWPVKANLRARLNNLDELSGGILNSTVFVSILNPLRSVGE
jgi:siderophore synthetase component